LKKTEKPRFPKFIHYAAHAETLGVFLEALGIRRVSRVPPAGALFIEFVRVAEEGTKEVSPDQLYLRFYLYNDLDHRSKGDQFKLLNISGLVPKLKNSLFSAT
jgi:hypothetical protein